jgi:uncharacterized repeat protein (TIGR01451 family)
MDIIPLYNEQGELYRIITFEVNDTKPLVTRYSEYNVTSFDKVYIGQETMNETTMMRLLLQELSMNFSINGTPQGDLSLELDAFTIRGNESNGTGYVNGTYIMHLDNFTHIGRITGQIKTCVACTDHYFKISAQTNDDVYAKIDLDINTSSGIAEGSLMYRIHLADPIFGEGSLHGTVQIDTTDTMTASTHLSQYTIGGRLNGDYDDTLHGIITSIEFPDLAAGFAYGSYQSAKGNGEIGFYLELDNQSMQTTGFFTGPISGISDGVIDRASGSVFLNLYLIDGFMPKLYVEAITKDYAAVGDDTPYLVKWANYGSRPAENVYVALSIPNNVTITYTDGRYHPIHDKIVWYVGTLDPGQTGQGIVNLAPDWGLRAHTKIQHKAMIGTTTKPAKGANLDIDPFLNEKKVVSVQVTPTEEAYARLQILLEDDPRYADIYEYAFYEGFTYPAMIFKLDYEDGTSYTEIKVSNPSLNERASIIRHGDSYFIGQIEHGLIHFYDQDGGVMINISRNGTSYAYGAWNDTLDNGTPKMKSIMGCKYGNIADCMKNKILEKMTDDALDKLESYLLNGATGGAYSGIEAITEALDNAGTIDDCIHGETFISTDCASSLGQLLDDVPGIGELTDLTEMLDECSKGEASPCSPGDEMIKCESNEWGGDVCVKYYCKEEDGYIYSQCSWEEWNTEDCTYGFSGPKCGHTNIGGQQIPCPGTCQNSRCICTGGKKCGIQDILQAKDPNEKYGPNRHVLPDETFDYTVAFENVGDGSAFGVYVTDVLDEKLNTSTLAMHTNYTWEYNNASRMITWYVGRVNPHKGGNFSYSIQPIANLMDGEQIINYATVYFASVPEELNTNPVVSTIDLLPPELNNLSVIPRVESALFSWKNNEEANATVCLDGIPQCVFSNASLTHEVEIFELERGTAYNFTINSCDTVGRCTMRQGSFETKTSGSPTDGPIPLGLMVSFVNRTPLLEWNVVNDSISYAVYESDEPMTNGTFVEESLETSWKDTTFVGQEKYYHVSAVKNDSEWISEEVGGAATARIVQGWNLISLRFDQKYKELGDSSLVGDPFPTDSPCIIELDKYDGSRFIPATYFEDNGWWGDNFTHVKEFEGYFAYAERNCSLLSAGSVIQDEKALSLQEGWNLIGWSYPLTALLGNESEGIHIAMNPQGCISEIDYYAGSFINSVYFSGYGWYSSSGLDALVPGNAYFAYAEEDCEVTLLP